MKNLYLYLKYFKLKNHDKIIYVLTPPAQLSNIGDHAQVIGIKSWLADNYHDIPILEFNKDETIHLQWAIKKLTKKTDLIFIHSGGNMGDSGLWSEKGRRLTIQNFPENKIISLPQTIHFSDTDLGRHELKKSQEIYNRHKKLTIIARDFKSENLANNYFPKANIFSCPDFVLYLQNAFNEGRSAKSFQFILFCLRNDSESALNNQQREKILSLVNQPYKSIDTTLPRLITRRRRKKELDKIIETISNCSIIITDRFHGLIFAVLTKTPCIVISTTNHKLTSAFEWFDGINYVEFAKNIDDIPLLITKLKNLQVKEDKDWINQFFDHIKRKY
ncbi:MAG: polysaccharide pyruvyl transferase family protein [Prolixibacteraceae bacterium]|nr:polysaccharide pyruvyl transferase family protein [Prolixibacteraceae bacterium]